MHYAQCVWPTLAGLAAAHILPVTVTVDVNVDVPAAVDKALPPRQNSAFPVGADCAGSDGAWNCLTTAWQRCVNGNWTGLMNAAPGTMCKPVGLSFDFHILPVDTVTSSTSAACLCTSTSHATHTTTDCPVSSTATATTSPPILTALSTCTSTTARSTYGSPSGELVSGGAATGSRMLVTSAAVGLLAVGFARLLM